MRAFCIATLITSACLSGYASEEYELAERLSRIGVPNLALYILEKSDSPEKHAGLGKVYKELAVRGGSGVDSVTLIARAREHFDQYLATAPAGPVKDSVRSERAELDLELARERLKQAGEETDLEKKADYRREAREVFRDVVDDLRSVAMNAADKYKKAAADVRDLDEETIKRQNLQQKKLEAYRDFYLAMQRYIRAALEMIDAFEEDSPEKKTFVQSLCEEIEGWYNDYISEFDIDGMWLEFAWGYALAKVDEYDRAIAKFDDVLSFDPLEFPPRFRDYIAGIQEPTFYYKAKAQSESRHHEKAVGTVSEMMTTYPESKKDRWGLPAREVKSRALWALGKHEDAIREAMFALKDAEESSSQFVGNFKQLINEFYVWVMENNKSGLLELFTEPAVNYAIAQGFFMKDEFNKAIEGYRSVIRATRQENVPVSTRLRYELKAWVEMGLCYYKLGRKEKLSPRNYEAALAFEEAWRSFAFAYNYVNQKRTFQADNKKLTREQKQELEKVLPDDLKGPRAEEIEKLLEEAFDSVERASKNNIAVLARRYKASGNREDKRLVDDAKLSIRRYLGSGDVDEGHYDAGQLRMEQAESTLNPDESIGYLTQALAEFKKISSASRWFEHGLWRSGYACYRTIYQYHRKYIKVQKAGRIPGEVYKKMHELVRQMDYYFDRYYKYVEANQTFDDKLIERRRERSETTPVLRTIAYYYSALYERVADEGREVAETIKISNPNYAAFMWYYLKSLCESAEVAAEKGEYEKMAGLLERADKSRRRFLEKDGLRRYYNAGSSTVALTMGKIAGILSKKSKDEEKPGLLEKAREYLKRRAEILAEIIEKDDPPIKRAAAGFRLLKLGLHEEAMSLFEGVLNGYKAARHDDINRDVPGLDPDKDNKVQDIPRELFEELTVGGDRIVLPDEKDTDKAVSLLRQLPPLLLDKETINYKKALGILDQILELIGDIPQRKKVELVKEEVTNRRIILAVRTGIVQCYIELARAAQSEDASAKAQELFAKAEQDAASLLDFWPKDRDLLDSLAGAKRALGKFGEASVVLRRLQNLYDAGSDRFIELQKRICEVLAEGEIKDCLHSEITRFHLTTPMEAIEKVWPSYKEDKARWYAAFELEDVELDVETREVDYTVISPADKRFRQAVEGIEGQAGREGWDEEKAVEAKKQKTIDHLRKEIASSFYSLETNYVHKEINLKQRELWERRILLKYLGTPVIENRELRSQAAELLKAEGIKPEELNRGIPLKLLENYSFEYLGKPFPVLDKAKEMGIISDEGKLLVEDPAAELARLDKAIDDAATPEEE